MGCPMTCRSAAVPRRLPCRAASRRVSTKRLRVRLRLSGKVVKEPKPIHVVTSKGQRAAVEAIVQASQELDACRDVGAYARRSMRRLQQCAKNRVKVVESQLPGPLPAKPVIADAEAAFASAGLKTPDAVEDCLVCWDFMTTFRAVSASLKLPGSRRWRRRDAASEPVAATASARATRLDAVDASPRERLVNATSPRRRRRDRQRVTVASRGPTRRRRRHRRDVTGRARRRLSRITRARRQLVPHATGNEIG